MHLWENGGDRLLWNFRSQFVMRGESIHLRENQKEQKRRLRTERRHTRGRKMKSVITSL